MKQLIKEARRMQQLAGLIKESESTDNTEDPTKQFFKNALMKAAENRKFDALNQMLDDDYSISLDLTQAELDSSEDQKSLIDSEIDFANWDAVVVNQELVNDINKIIG
jgi:hypothetical protein